MFEIPKGAQGAWVKSKNGRPEDNWRSDGLAILGFFLYFAVVLVIRSVR